MDNQAKLYGVIGLLAGILLGIFVSAYVVNNQITGMMRKMGMGRGAEKMMSAMMGSGTGMGMSMEDMIEALEGKSGDELEKTFLEEMMTHHQGAISMAEKIKAGTKRAELKQMADEIIQAQAKEIDQMRQWMKDWFGQESSLEAPPGVSEAEHLSHHPQ